MELKDLFYSWVPIWIKLPVLFFLFFVLLSANGIYLGNSTDMYSGLGVYPEPFSEAFNAVYIGMGLGLMIEVRLKRRFSNKTLLLWGLSMMLLMNIVCMVTGNPGLVVAACLVLGFTKMAAFMEVYLIWIFIWSKKADRSRVYPFVYLTALSGSYFFTWFTTRLAYTYNWRYAYIGILILVLICLLLSLILVENHPLKRRFPLYQMDWQGMFLLLAALLLINYVAVYGRVEDWFGSDKIKAALILLPVAVFGFIRRELTVRRPLLPFRLFRASGFRKGLFLFLLLGIFLPSSIQSLFTAGILHFESIRNAELNLYMIPGLAAGAVIAFAWYYYKRNPDILLFSGFLAFVIYYILLYVQLAAGLGLQNFWLLSLIKGFGLVILYISIGLYTIATFQMDTVLTAAGVMIIVRSFLGSGIFSGLYSYFLYAGRIKHLDHLAGLTAAGDYLADQRVGPEAYYQLMQQQAALTASKEMTGTIILIGLVILGGIFLSQVIRGVEKKGRIFNQ
jgi:MFS family permease